MRDPRRIDEVLAALRAVWITMPDMRLGQLVCNLVPPTHGGGPFHFEDDALLERLIRLRDTGRWDE